jgi:DdrB-like protein
MSDIDEKLIVKLGQRISEQNEILRMIAASLRGVESHLRQIAVSSNPAPNNHRPLSEYPTFDWPSIGATVLNRDGDGATTVEWNGQVFTRRSPSNKKDDPFYHCAFGGDADYIITDNMRDFPPVRNRKRPGLITTADAVAKLWP